MLYICYVNNDKQTHNAMFHSSITMLCNQVAATNRRRRPYAYNVDAVCVDIETKGWSAFQGYTITKVVGGYEAA